MIYLGFGSNLGNRSEALKSGLQGICIGGLNLVKTSSFWETPAWGKTDQPAFLNIVAAFDGSLSAENLLKLIQKVENEAGRVRHEKWGPRLLDIDILDYHGEISRQEGLNLPHPYIDQRAFVLLPLIEIAPNYLNPQTGQSAKDSLSLLDGEEVRNCEKVNL